MAKRVKQLEAEAADLQASWDAERRDLLRRELLTSQLCDAMVPHLRPGCPFRDIAAARAAATWCDELGRWRLPDASSHILLPPPSLIPRDNLTQYSGVPSKPDLNNNNNSKPNEDEPDGNNEDNVEENNEETKKEDIADTYFRRSRINTLLAHAREAKTFETSNRLSKSGGAEDMMPLGGNYLQLNALNLQSSAPVGDVENYRPSQRQATGRVGRTGWLFDESSPSKSSPFANTFKKNPPRILEALPSYPQGTNGITKTPFRIGDKSITERISDRITSRLIRNDDLTDRHAYHVGHARSPTY